MENTIINPFETSVNPYPESLVKSANEFKEYMQASENRETYHQYYLENGEKLRMIMELRQKAENQKYVAERKRLLKRLIVLNGLIGDVK